MSKLMDVWSTDSAHQSDRTLWNQPQRLMKPDLLITSSLSFLQGHLFYELLPEESAGREVHDGSSFLHPDLQVLTLWLHGQRLRNGLQQLTVALGATVSPLPPLTGFALMLQPGIVQPHSLLQEPLEVPEFTGANTVEARVAELWGDKGLRWRRATAPEAPTTAWGKDPMWMTVLQASLLSLQPREVPLVEGAISPTQPTVQLMVERQEAHWLLQHEVFIISLQKQWRKYT